MINCGLRYAVLKFSYNASEIIMISISNFYSDLQCWLWLFGSSWQLSDRQCRLIIKTNIFNGFCHEFIENFKKVYRSERRRLKRKKRADKNKELDDCSLHLSDDPNCPEKENNVTDNTKDYKTEYDELNVHPEAPEAEDNKLKVKKYNSSEKSKVVKIHH